MNKVLRGLARAVSLLAAVAVAAVIILYPRLVAEDSASVPHGFLVVLLMGMSAAWGCTVSVSCLKTAFCAFFFLPSWPGP